jgi:hypothetical protein
MKRLNLNLNEKDAGHPLTQRLFLLSFSIKRKQIFKLVGGTQGVAVDIHRRGDAAMSKPLCNNFGMYAFVDE